MLPSGALCINLDRDAHLRHFQFTPKNNRLQISNPTKVSGTSYKKLNLMNILQHCANDFVAGCEPGYMCIYLYWTPKLHKSPYKHQFIAGSSKYMTKDLSCLLTKTTEYHKGWIGEVLQH